MTGTLYLYSINKSILESFDNANWWNVPGVPLWAFPLKRLNGLLPFGERGE